MDKNNFDFSIKEDISELFNTFILEIDILPGFGNEYNKSLQSFTKQKNSQQNWETNLNSPTSIKKIK